MLVARGAGAAETWTQVETASFTVVSNAGEGTARRTATEFEQARAAYLRIWPWMKAARIKPTVVVALKDENAMRRWAPGYYEGKGGVSWVSVWVEGADRLYMLLRTDARPADQAVTPNYNLYRAYLGILLAETLERPFPQWLSNGLAGVLGNVSVHDREILLGRPVPWQFESFRATPRLPLQTVLDVRRDSPLLEKEAERQQFDAQCYVLVHYLLFGDRVAGSAKLDSFQRLWLAGATQDRALRESIGDIGAIEGALANHARAPVLRFATFDVEAKIAAARPAARAVSPAETAGLQAAVHVALNRPVEAQAAIREARSGDPRLAVSYDAEGVLADRDRDEPRAKEAYAQAVELGSKSPYSHYRAAQLVSSAKPDATTLAFMRLRLERAIELDPGYANAHSFLAETLVQQNEGTAALPLAERAVSLEPGNSYHRVALARVLHQLGRSDEARQAVEHGLRLARDGADRANAERFALFLDESARFATERSRQESKQKLASACQNGEAAACTQMLPALEQGCSAGEASTCSYLAWLHGEGRGVEKNRARATAYMERACAAGDKHGCVEHAWALLHGEGLARDERKGTAALEGLCNGGSFAACTRLAYALLERPAAAERTRARALLTRACEGGEQDACSAAKQIR